MKRAIIALIGAVALIAVLSAGCGKTGGSEDGSRSLAQTFSKDKPVTLKVLADQVPHAELLNFVKPELASLGVNLDITILQNDHGNEDTDNGEFDVNFFQHQPYLDSVSKEKGYDLANAGNIHVEPIGLYSAKYRTREELPENAVIGIPNDVTNEYRALKILEQNGFIKLKADLPEHAATIKDIAEYTRKIELKEIDSAQLIRLKEDFDGYITNTNKILEAGIDANSALFREGKDSPYANILVTKSSRVNEPAIVALKNALTTPEVRKFIEDKYKGAVIPAF
ncbi:membrane lipoprotein TpN32 precursor [Ruminiclostridium hungatei]|uniref:Lipoprotein n=1 Tax=Ruminiclostridium hungatei TaxID=48256 RepID=A0A1V4SF17_RUMHU|nr:MetQ/NlpA family ABC transporter substrate-binding protein [Ruminiclostridium hungatei]OPX42512.1 membrane lipoprotein TpN32 precursor [Ruminiclostridium hungatei]